MCIQADAINTLALLQSSGMHQSSSDTRLVATIVEHKSHDTDNVILTRSGSLDIGYKVWMTPLPVKEDKSG